MTTTTLTPPTRVELQQITVTVPVRALVFCVAGVALLPLMVRTTLFAAVLQSVGLLLIPGLCTISLIRLRSRGPVVLLALAVAASIAADLLVLGALDIVSLWLARARPLDQPSLQLQLAAFWLLLALAVHLFGDDLVVEVPSRISPADVLILCCAGSALVQAQAGARILNGGGSGGFVVAAYVFVAAAFLLMVLLTQATSRDVLQLAMVLLAIALLLSNSLRSPYLSGVDINFEYQVASLVQSAGVWDPGSFRDAYMACLSSSLFPVVLSNLSGLALMGVFKVVMPVLFGLVVVFVHEVARHYVGERGAVVASFFFLVQPAFQQWLSIPVRQEVALLLLSVSLWALLGAGLSRAARVTVFWLTSLGMLVSHYTTVYIACVVYLVALGVDFARSRGRRTARQERPVLSLSGVIALSVGAILWYGPATTHTYAVAEFAAHSATGVGAIFDPSVQQQDQSVFGGFGAWGGSAQRDWVPTYVEETTREYQERYGAAALLGPASSAAHVREADLASGPAHEPWLSLLTWLRVVAKVLAPVVIAVGVVRSWRSRRQPDLGTALVAGSFLTGLALVSLPFASINYDLNRLYQQLLILLAPMLVVGANYVAPRLRNGRAFFGGALVVLYFALLSRVAFQPVGGPDLSMTFNNRGWDYSIYYTHPDDLAAADWLTRRWSADHPKPLVFADSVAETRLRLVAPVTMSAKMKPDVLPTTFVRGSYLYLDRTNVALGGAVIREWRSRTLSLTVDQHYFDTHLDRVYSTPSTAVYR